MFSQRGGKKMEREIKKREIRRHVIFMSRELQSPPPPIYTV
jgi:hypothetical protein